LEFSSYDTARRKFAESEDDLSSDGPISNFGRGVLLSGRVPSTGVRSRRSSSPWVLNMCGCWCGVGLVWLVWLLNMLVATVLGNLRDSVTTVTTVVLSRDS
jgi:hypothetical protein